MSPKGLQAAEQVPDGRGPLTAQVLGDLSFDAVQITEVWRGAGRRRARQVAGGIRYANERFPWLK